MSHYADIAALVIGTLFLIGLAVNIIRFREED